MTITEPMVVTAAAHMRYVELKPGPYLLAITILENEGKYTSVMFDYKHLQSSGHSLALAVREGGEHLEIAQAWQQEMVDALINHPPKPTTGREMVVSQDGKLVPLYS